MKAYIFDNNKKEINEKDSVIALGSFYSMHLGHQEVFKQTLKIAKDKNLKSGVLLLNEMSINKQKETYSLNWRVDYLLNTGFDFIIIFDKIQQNFSVEGPDFIDHLEKYYGAKHFVAGKDFKFGSKRKNSIAQLSQYKETTIVDFVKYGNAKISTSVVNQSIELCDLKLIYGLLGRNFSFSGEVVIGEGVARKLGMRTANVEISKNSITMPEGVFISHTKLNGLLYPSLTSIGRKQTMHKDWELTLETHLLNFNKDIYGENLEVFLVEKIRNQEKFRDVEEVIKQLRVDKDYAINWFTKNKL